MWVLRCLWILHCNTWQMAYPKPRVACPWGIDSGQDSAHALPFKFIWTVIEKWEVGSDISERLCYNLYQLSHTMLTYLEGNQPLVHFIPSVLESRCCGRRGRRLLTTCRHSIDMWRLNTISDLQIIRFFSLLWIVHWFHADLKVKKSNRNERRFQVNFSRHTSWHLRTRGTSTHFVIARH